MSESVACNQCGTILDEDPGIPAENRKPCPICGSLTRQISVSIQLKAASLMAVGGSVTASVFNASSLLLQAVVVPGAKTHEGLLIEAVTLPWFDIIALLENDPSLAYQISAIKWEEIVAGAYQKAGFDEVTLTPRSGDYGRNIIAVKRGLGTVRIIDQVKAYNPNHLVTADDVRALLGVLEGDKASKGFLTTTSDFAPKLRDDILIKQFIPARIELINGKMLLTRLIDLAERRSSK